METWYGHTENKFASGNQRYPRAVIWDQCAPQNTFISGPFLPTELEGATSSPFGDTFLVKAKFQTLSHLLKWNPCHFFAICVTDCRWSKRCQHVPVSNPWIQPHPRVLDHQGRRAGGGKDFPRSCVGGQECCLLLKEVDVKCLALHMKILKFVKWLVFVLVVKLHKLQDH